MSNIIWGLGQIIILGAVIVTISKINEKVKENNEILKRIDNYIRHIEKEKQYNQQQNYQNYNNENHFNPYN